MTEFHTGIGAETKIRLTNGRNYRIKDLVEQEIPGSVYVLNESNSKIEPRKIIGWRKTEARAPLENWKHIIATGYDSSGGFLGGSFLNDTKLLTDKGYTKIKDIPAALGDKPEIPVSPLKLKSWIRTEYNGSLISYIAALLAGHGAKLFTKNQRHANSKYRRVARIKVSDNNLRYLSDKIDVLSELMHMKKARPNSGRKDRFPSYFTPSTSELALLYYKINGAYTTWFLENYATPQTLAIWFANSGILNPDFSLVQMDYHYLELMTNDIPANWSNLPELMHQKFGLNCTVNLENGRFVFDQTSGYAFLKIIAPYVPKRMQELLPFKLRTDKPIDFIINNQPTQTPIWTYILELRPALPKMNRDRHVYSLKIENADNMFIGSVDNGFVMKL